MSTFRFGVILFHRLQVEETVVKKLIRSLLAKFGYQIHGTRMTPRLLLQAECRRGFQFDDAVSRLMVEKGAALSFIQVGAFDGQVQDPLQKYITKFGWRGLMIEPQPLQAQKLRELYSGNDNITVVEAAVDSSAGAKPFYVVNAPGAPHWAGALASFHKEVILKHTDLIPGLEAMIDEVQVECITFDQVMKKLPTGQIDLLQIDTEGADGLILSLFPFERFKPAIVHFEVRHLSFAEREATLDRLAAHGYRFAPSGDQDMLAVLI
jgi:FkbM family methyltransferase